MANHRLDAAPETVHWGYFDARLKPLISVASGDTVTISTVSGMASQMPGAPYVIPKALTAIQQSVPQKLPGHICTGPVAVKGAKAGQVLEVRIKDIQFHYDWGYNMIRPLAGALPDDFDTPTLIHIPLDKQKNTGRLPWGLELRLAPFFGVMAVAPPPAWGMVSTLPPRRNGGNLDNKELVKGTTLYLPIHHDGALFSVGDGHGAQGDGEVCVTAVEMRAQVTLRFGLQRGRHLPEPQLRTTRRLAAGTNTGPWFATTAHGPDLFASSQRAVLHMIDHLVRERGFSRE